MAKKDDVTVGKNELAEAIVTAIEVSRPQKKTPFNRKRNTPWTPKDGSPKLKMKRKFYHHGILIGDNVSNEEIALLNKLRPGSYMGGFVRVIRRKDKGLDIDYPVKTSSQRLKLLNEFGIYSFEVLLQRCIDEAARPKVDEFASEDDE
jgi:hypothetical protein